MEPENIYININPDIYDYTKYNMKQVMKMNIYTGCNSDIHEYMKNYEIKLKRDVRNKAIDKIIGND